MSPAIDALRAAVPLVLAHPRSLEWTVQGFGMLRCYLDAAHEFRLNIWHSSLRVENVSTVHDHPWDFTSWVLSGELGNEVFLESQHGWGWSEYLCQEIVTGEGGGSVGPIYETSLCATPVQWMKSGADYYQDRKVIHATHYKDGTVTLNARTPVTGESRARVFWPSGGEWVDAEPRAATEAEVDRIVKCAMERWELRHITEPWRSCAR